ncbi:hypothetical protein [Algoriphagus litoralis]|uniref:hypothetical protein n=1 Tax=Algoriphagus litoralis TaxID=2202829 RepID=UPI000DB91050|nr:hypothetical protein [Algoriphagus litoralis]
MKLDSTQKTLLGIFLSFLIAACSTGIEEPEQIQPLPEVVNKGCNPKDPCCFDLSGRPGEYDLLDKWEFVGFQKSKEGYIDHLTCLARIAEFALGGEDFDNIFQITLQLSDKSSDHGLCDDFPDFEFRSFNHEILGCYESNSEGLLKFNFTEENITFFASPATTTLPMQEFETGIKKALSAVESYEIDENKLYLKVKDKSEKMLFLAMEDSLN